MPRNEKPKYLRPTTSMQVATEIAISAQPPTIAHALAIEPNHLSDACIKPTPPRAASREICSRMTLRAPSGLQLLPLRSGGQTHHLSDRVVPIADAAGVGAAPLGPALEHDVLHGGLEDGRVSRGRLDLDELTRLAGGALAGAGRAVQAHGVLVDDGLPPLVGLPLHRALHERLGLVVELAPAGKADDGERHGEADR